MNIRKKVSYTDTSGADMIKCPFFSQHGAGDICCEGLVGKETIHRFHDPKERRDFEKRYCEGNQKNCWYHLMLMQAKYPQEGEED